MTGARSGALAALATHRVLPVVLLIFFGATLLAATRDFAAVGGEGGGAGGGVVDFHAFHTVGRMVWEGTAAEAYHLPSMEAAQRRLTGREGAMPWTYPPQFDLVAALLGALPPWLAHLVFAGGGLAAFVLAIRALAGAGWALVLLAVAPAIHISLVIGQNGLLIGALAGAVALGALAGRPWAAGVALGLMALKPHLGLGLGLAALAQGWWRLVAAAALSVLGTTLLATLALGPAIWPAFLGGVAEAGGFLAEGRYQLFRMTSAYAAVATLGGSPGLALWLQAVTALAAGLAILAAARRGMERRRFLGLAAIASVFVSPYTYDYDLTILAVGLALLLPDLLARARGVEAALLVTLCWVASGAGFLTATLQGGDAALRAIEAGDPPASVGFLALVAVAALLARVLGRARDPAALPA